MRLYTTLLEEARQPAFYAEMGVPDTVDGRFDMLMLHAVLLLRRLHDQGPEADRMSQSLFGVLFDDMDRSVREIGIGDISVGRHVKKMGEAFNGRYRAYDAALGSPDDQPLIDALTRNIYLDDPPDDGSVARLAATARSAATALERQDLDKILAGSVRFA